MYCDKQALIDRFGITELESYAWDSEADAIDDDRIVQACSDASETVDLYIAATVQLPLASTPEVVERLASDIARYRLQSVNPLDATAERYKAAIATLKDIAAGRAVLTNPIHEPQASTVDAKRGDADRVFTRESLAGF